MNSGADTGGPCVPQDFLAPSFGIFRFFKSTYQFCQLLVPFVTLALPQDFYTILRRDL